MPASAQTSANHNAGGQNAMYDVERLRRDFPILHQQVHGRSLVYLDNAATTQKPQPVIDTISHYYLADNANIHRGVHTLSMRATDAYEAARTRVQRLLNAASPAEIIFVRGATEGINLVAQAYARPHLQSGDEVIISAMEHHSNIVPWQIVCDQTGAHLRVVPINDRGELLIDEYARMLSDRTRIVAITQMSNALGSVNPVENIIELAHRRGIPVLVDGAQAVSHLRVDVRELDADFYVLSGHKIYGPTGIGVLYGKAALLNDMQPYQGGGDMILSVTFEKTTYNTLPYKFEAGTPNIEGVIGLAAAIDYVSAVGLDAIAAWESRLLEHGTEALRRIDGVTLIGTAARKASILSFVIEGIHPHDIGTILDQQGIAIRTGHHCAQPVMDRFGIPATARASLGLYNTPDEMDALAAGICEVKRVFG